jgi:hypothetical protein
MTDQAIMRSLVVQCGGSTTGAKKQGEQLGVGITAWEKLTVVKLASTWILTASLPYSWFVLRERKGLCFKSFLDHKDMDSFFVPKII